MTFFIPDFTSGDRIRFRTYLLVGVVRWGGKVLDLDNMPKDKGEGELLNVEKIRDPHQLISRWRDSGVYKRFRLEFFEGKSLAEDVTEEEKDRVFEEDRKAKISLLNFVKEDRLVFVYDSRMYSEEVKRAMRNYLGVVSDMFKSKREGVDGDKTVRIDQLRSLRHQEVSRALVEDGVVLSEKIGRTLARLVLIARGWDTFESASRKDVDRVKVLLLE